jgi:hypothetical protein
MNFDHARRAGAARTGAVHPHLLSFPRNPRIKSGEEPMNTDLHWLAPPVFMGSGFGLSGRPGMTRRAIVG